MQTSHITAGMRVLSRDRRLIGTVENVENDDFTLVDTDSGASARVRFELVDPVDGDVHLLIGPCGLDSRR